MRLFWIFFVFLGMFVVWVKVVLDVVKYELSFDVGNFFVINSIIGNILV